MSIGTKLLNIQQKVNAPKNQYNKFGDYYYRSCEDILQAVKPILAENNCTLVIWDEPIQVGERHYIKATAELTDCDDGNKTTVQAYAREEETKKGMDGSQITGSASSYARKYALNGLFCLDDTKDADATNTDDDKKQQERPQQNKPAQAQQDKPNDAQFKKLAAAAKEAGYSPEAMGVLLRTKYSVESSKQLTKQQISELIEFLEGVANETDAG